MTWLQDPRFLIDLAGLILAAALPAIYARVRSAKIEQRVEDRLGVLETYKETHEKAAAKGFDDLTALKAGMSEGAEAGFKRVEDQINRVLEATSQNAVQIGQLSGEVRGLTSTVTQLLGRMLHEPKTT